MDPLQQPPVPGRRERQVVIVGEPGGPSATEDADGQLLIDHDHGGGTRLGSAHVSDVATQDGVGRQVSVQRGLELLDQIPGRHPLERFTRLGREPAVASPATTATIV